LDRRELLAYSAAFGSPFLAAQGMGNAADTPPKTSSTPFQGKKYPFKKSINLWAFPYPDKMTLKECLQLAKDAGFDGVELNYNLEGDVSPEASDADLKNLRKMADEIGIAISGLCSFLFWPYSLTSNDPDRRSKGRELAKKMIHAAAALGTENLLVVPGAVYIPWAPEPEPVPNDVCHRRATEAIREVLPLAQKLGVSINIENIFANGFLLSPLEMNDFVDGFQHDSVGIHFDTGNIMQFQYPEHWIEQCGKRIRNVHLKEYSKRAGTEFTLDSFRPLLDGTTNWPAVLDAFERIGYRGYLTFEIFSFNQYYPEPLIYHTSNAMDAMLGRIGTNNRR
ncbi:MAG: sugar phosphate isomerase/epimerase, partial [Planctomycetaceae bacterium]|nr:sugar phosphate isomerase/epimerase [Planctomycetaceae bacterium]